MDSRPHALALLPERQAHYDGCRATLDRAIAAGKPASVYSTQQWLCYSLASLNRTRAAAGLSAMPMPKLLTFDEVLQLEKKECTNCGGTGCANCHGGKEQDNA
jgi:hypothetical protein